MYQFIMFFNKKEKKLPVIHKQPPCSSRGRTGLSFIYSKIMYAFFLVQFQAVVVIADASR